MITEFQGEYRWLSNFAFCAVEWNGMKFNSVECAYQAAKCNDSEWHKYCQINRSAVVKKASRNIAIRFDWDSYKLILMRDLQEQKYKQEPFLSLLRNTGDQEIQEGNYWGDTFWGVDLNTGKGDNNLGKMIMEIRNLI